MNASESGEVKRIQPRTREDETELDSWRGAIKRYTDADPPAGAVAF
jgi:hypothetical protein